MDPLSYEIRVRGQVSDAVLRTFDPLDSDITQVETVLHGPVRDQAELHGLLAKVRDLGTALISVTSLGVTGSDGAATGSRQQQHR